MNHPQRSASVNGPMLVVGNGLIGAPLARALSRNGFNVRSVGRTPLDLPRYLACDLGSDEGLASLRQELVGHQPSRVVLVHGPSDVTWIEANERAASRAHCGVAQLLADLGLPAVFVSTDNVFAGERGGHVPSDDINPGNAYGRIKARAEKLLTQSGVALVLRVSLVYGWREREHRINFAERCLLSALDGMPLEVPHDQIFTPIHTRDVATVIAGICASTSAVTGIRHLAGPSELSRFEFAKLAYSIAGADAELVRPCLRRDTHWASRPAYSSLKCDDFADIAGLHEWKAMTPDVGLQAMLLDYRGEHVRK